jgi:hypothetical protein
VFTGLQRPFQWEIMSWEPNIKIQCCESALVSVRVLRRIRIQLLTSNCIRGSRSIEPNQCWYISLLLDPDPHSQYGSGFRRAKSIRIHADTVPQHCSIQILSCYREAVRLTVRKNVCRASWGSGGSALDSLLLVGFFYSVAVFARVGGFVQRHPCK